MGSSTSQSRNWMFLMAFLAAGQLAIAGEERDGESSSVENPAPAYSLNVAKSTIYWEGSKPGGKHFGTLEVRNGKASTDGELITGGSFEIDMNSISNDDIKKEDTREKLVGHLKSDDFFSVEKFPTATFVISEVVEGSPGLYKVRGDLTIKGISHEISFPARISMDDQMIHATSDEIVLDRTLWQVNYKSKSVFSGLKDSFISDEMKIKLDVHFTRM